MPFFCLYISDAMAEQGFKKEERLSHRKEIAEVFEKGRRNTKYFIHMICHEVDPDRKPPVKVVFSVPKKRFKRAVDRNLLKRRMREAYRINKKLLDIGNKAYNIMFIYNADEVRPFAEIENKIVLLLEGLNPGHETDS